MTRYLPRLDVRELASIFIGGAGGAALRVELTNQYPGAPTSWPWAVFAINISGAVLLGYLVTRLQDRLPLSTYRRPLLGTGFCGAYTTFSTMQQVHTDMLLSLSEDLPVVFVAVDTSPRIEALLDDVIKIKRKGLPRWSAPACSPARSRPSSSPRSCPRRPS